MAKFIPDWTYVSKKLQDLKFKFTATQMIVGEYEALRYFEDKIILEDDEEYAGLEVHIGLLSELIENVKAALTANTPVVSGSPHREGDEAKKNVTKRQKFWKEFIRWSSNPVPYLNEIVDAQAGLSYGIWKIGQTAWPSELKKRRNEDSIDYLDRARGIKKQNGPPIGQITVHPNSFYFEIGVGNQLKECIEESYKPIMDIYLQYGGDKVTMPSESEIADKASQDDLQNLGMTSGMPNEITRPMPDGFDATTSVLVTEYWNADVYQVYVNNEKVYEESPPSVKYILVPGRSTSSKDPSKFTIGIGESLRNIEPVINRMLTRMAEATDLLVRKRLALELPIGSAVPTQLDTDGNMVPKTYRFRDDAAETLPEGAHIQDPFDGAEKAFGSMPMIELALQIAARQSVSPIFKGMPPGAAGSGYRDNSLYLMARSQFQYMIDALQFGGAEAIRFMEWLLVNKIKQEIWCNEEVLTPEDIKDWPVTWDFVISPALPQNNIANGTFLDRMHTQGHITRERVQREGLNIEHPEEESFAKDLEDLFDMAKPLVFQDVIKFVYGGGPQVTNPQGQPLVDKNGNPLQSMGGDKNAPGGAEQVLSNAPGRAMGREMGGYGTQGQPKQQPGSVGM